MAPMQPVSVRDLLERAVPDDEWLAPLDPRLRTSLYWCAGGMVTAIPVGIFATPLLASWTQGGLFFFLGPLSVFLLSLLRSPVGIGVNLIALALFGLLYWQSNQLESATIPWQRLGLGLSIVGALDITTMTLPLAIVVLNIVVWVLIIVAALCVAGFVLGALSMAR